MGLSLWPKGGVKKSGLYLHNPTHGENQEIDLRQKMKDLLEGTDYSPQRGHWVLLRRMETQQRCTCWNEVGEGDEKEFNPTIILELFEYCDEILMFGADYYSKYLPIGSWYVWDKRVDEKFDRMIGSAFELCWSKAKHKREIARFNNTLFSGELEARNKVHPTQKPTKMIEWFFQRIKGSNVADLFLGSGSTLIACEKTGRKCYGMEIDPHYCSVIIKRWQDFTGREAKQIA